MGNRECKKNRKIREGVENREGREDKEGMGNKEGRGNRKVGKLWKGVKVLSSKFEDIFHFILRILTKLILYKKV